MSVAENIASIRKAVGLTQSQLGERVGVARQTVVKWESGVAQPDLANLQVLAQVLGVSIDTLVGFEASRGEAPFLSQGKHHFGRCKIGSYGTVRIPAEAMEAFGFEVGDELIVLGDDNYGISMCKPGRIRAAIKALEDHLLS